MASCSQVNSLFQAYLDGELAGAEKSILEHHLRDCPACREELSEQNACAARIFEALSDERLVWGLRSRVLAHLPEMDPPIKGSSHPTDPQFARRKQRSRFPGALVAAAAILLVFAALFFYTSPGPNRVIAAPMGMVTFEDGEGVLRRSAGEETYATVALKSLVSAGETYETLPKSRLAMALIGGSTVKVNHDTTLAVDDNRRVAVERGEVFFDIGRDRRHFYVDTPTGEILVFGTAFLVDVMGATTTVTVAEGNVLVRNGKGKSAVPAGNQLTFTANAAPGQARAVNVAPLIAWANAIVPDPEATALFLRTLELRRTLGASIPAHPIHIAEIADGKLAESVVVEWTPDGIYQDHCGFFVQVTDGAGNLLLLDVLEAELFNRQQGGRVELPLTNGPIGGLDTVHVKLVPDYTNGSVVAEHQVFVSVVRPAG